MKKLLLAFTFMAYFVNGQAPYNKLLGTNTTEWDIFNDYIPLIISQGGHGQSMSVQSVQYVPAPTYGRYFAKVDTMVLSKNYKKYLYSAASSTATTHIGYLREDTVARKVYYLDKVTLTESLLYNFSLNVGDTVYLAFPGTSGTFPKGYYQVKLINNVMTRVGLRKQFCLQSPGSDTLKCIESIGSIIHPTYLGTSFYGAGTFAAPPSAPGACAFPYELGLACKFSDNQKYYQSCTYVTATYNSCIQKLDSCNYYNTCSSVQEFSILKFASLYPNPAAGTTNLSLSMNLSSTVTIEVTDVMGRLVKTIYKNQLPVGENNLELYLGGIEQGSYFLNIRAGDESSKLPLIVMY